MQDLLKQLLKLAEDLRLTHVQAEELGHKMSVDEVGELVHQIVACVMLIDAEDPTEDYVRALLDEISNQADRYQRFSMESAERMQQNPNRHGKNWEKFAAIDSERQHNQAMKYLNAMDTITEITGVHHGE